MVRGQVSSNNTLEQCQMGYSIEAAFPFTGYKSLLRRRRRPASID